MTDFIINGSLIGAGYSTYIIAELSANHNQSFEQAVSLIKAAKDAGAAADLYTRYNHD
jgi:pseudaminic acid synthase